MHWFLKWRLTVQRKIFLLLIKKMPDMISLSLQYFFSAEILFHVEEQMILKSGKYGLLPSSSQSLNPNMWMLKHYLAETTFVRFPRRLILVAIRKCLGNLATPPIDDVAILSINTMPIAFPPLKHHLLCRWNGLELLWSVWVGCFRCMNYFIVSSWMWWTKNLSWVRKLLPQTMSDLGRDQLVCCWSGVRSPGNPPPPEQKPSSCQFHCVEYY